MIVVLKHSSNARLVVGGKPRVIRLGQGVELTEEQWAEVPADLKALFEVQDDGGDDVSENVAALSSRLLRVENKLATRDDFPIYGINKGASGNITLPASGNGVEIAGCLVTVPPTEEDVWLDAFFVFQQTVIGAGQAFLYIYEGPNTALVQRTSFVGQLPNNIGATKYGQVGGKWNLGPTPVARHFHLRAVSTVAVQVFTTVLNPCYLGAVVL